MTFVRTKLKLERMKPGEILGVRLRGEEPPQRSPRCARGGPHHPVDRRCRRCPYRNHSAGLIIVSSDESETHDDAVGHRALAALIIGRRSPTAQKPSASKGFSPPDYPRRPQGIASALRHYGHGRWQPSTDGARALAAVKPRTAMVKSSAHRRRRGIRRSPRRAVGLKQQTGKTGEATSSARSCRVQARSPSAMNNSACSAAARSRSSAPSGRWRNGRSFSRQYAAHHQAG